MPFETYLFSLAGSRRHSSDQYSEEDICEGRPDIFEELYDRSSLYVGWVSLGTAVPELGDLNAVGVTEPQDGRDPAAALNHQR